MPRICSGIGPEYSYGLHGVFFLPLLSFVLSIIMSRITEINRSAYMNCHQTGYLRVSKDMEGLEYMLPSVSARLRKRDINSSVCPGYDEVHYGISKRSREEQVSYYPFP